MSRFKPPDSGRPDEGPQRSPEKTMGITPSQILEVSPRSSAPPPPRRQPEMSMWGGNVLLSEEFAPDAGRKKRRVPWELLGILVVVAAGGLVWRSWPKVPFSNVAWPGLSKTSPRPPAPPAPAAPTTPVAQTSPPAAPDAAAEIPALAPPSPSAYATPTEKVVAKKSHSTKSKHKRSKRHRKASKSSKHSPSTGF